jgi:hypothetical protein
VSYTLFLECAGLDEEAGAGLARALDLFLRENFHYDHARRLSQLGPVRVFLIDGKHAETYTAEMARRGMRLGDIKPSALDDRTGWSERFRGAYLGSERSDGRGSGPRAPGEAGSPSGRVAEP